MKKIVLLLSVLSSLFIISGCGSNDNKAKTTSSTKEEYADKAFLEDFKQGLYNRWDYSDNNDDTDPVEHYKNLADKELNHVAKYKDKKFKDSTLQE